MKLLVALHLLIGLSPVASFLVPPSMEMLPALWALVELGLAQLMLLSIWIGMSRHCWYVRVGGALGGTAYVAVWPVLSQFIAPYREYEMSLVKDFLTMFASYSAIVLLLSLAFLVMQRRGSRLIHVSQLSAQAPSSRPQYSMFRLLAAMSICSLVLSLVKVAHPSDETLGTLGVLATVAGYVLMLLTLLLTSLCAVWATLGPSPPHSRIAATIGIALLLGVAIAIASGNYTVSWWLFTAAALIPAVFTTIVIGSLLVVRSCGYRMATAEMIRPAT